MPRFTDPADCGLNPARWAAVFTLADRFVTDGRLPALELIAGRGADAAGPIRLGERRPGVPLGGDALFLVASLTKPVVATAALRLVERGEVLLGEPVRTFLPEYRGRGKGPTRLFHLLTHTAGLPDMLPQNLELRERGAPLSDFVAGACAVDLLFEPGRGCQYSSMGYVVLGAVLERVAGCPLPALLEREVFAPLGMTDSHLGLPPDRLDEIEPRVAGIGEPDEIAFGHEHVWNGRYWRTLGAPWGGLLASGTDLARFMACVADCGRCGDGVFLSPAALAAATRNRLSDLRHVPEEDRRCRPWGLGWRPTWPSHSAYFGDLLSPAAFGHWGSTGCVMWCDPQSGGTWCVLLTTRPQDPGGVPCARLSNAVAAAFAP